MDNMVRAQRNVSESMTSMRFGGKEGNVGAKGEREGYVVSVMKVLDREAPGVVVVMCSDRLIVSSQIWRRVAMSGMVLLLLRLLKFPDLRSCFVWIAGCDRSVCSCRVVCSRTES